jgi:Tol biopolymer transport system component
MGQLPKKWFLAIGTGLFFCCLTSLVVIYLMVVVYPATIKSSAPPLIFPTRSSNQGFPTLTTQPVATPALPDSSPKGKIVFVCQIFKLQAQDQLCLVNADGSGYRRLTLDDNARHFYPSFAPDGQSVLFSANLDGNFKIYEIGLDGKQVLLGNAVGIAPEVSPDNRLIVFTQSDGSRDTLWLMERDGSHQHLFYSNGWDPTWSPDGTRILFATMVVDKPQLAIINLDGSNFRLITDLPFLRGRSDWSADGEKIVTYNGEAWQRELVMLKPDGSDLHQISPVGGNSQGPSFSPDGNWVVFTAYFGSMGNNNGCEIYIVRIDGKDLTRLTNNNYCDWQPRWGP